MTNKHRGEIAVTLDGEPISLRLTTNSICALEEAEGVAFSKIMEGISDTGDGVQFLLIRKVFWALLLDARPDATLVDAGKVIDEMQGKHQSILADAISRAFPDAEEVEGK